MRIIFVGSVLFSEQALLKLLSLKVEIVGIVTKDASAFNADFCNLSSIAIANNIPFKFVRDINHPNNVQWMAELNPTLIFCFGWSNLLKKEVINLPIGGVIGYHPSKLPYNKGRHPLIWAKVLGLKSSGSTFFFMDEGADTGDILSQKEFNIDFEDDAAKVYKKMMVVALDQISEFVPKLSAGNYDRIPQDKTIGNAWRKRGKNDGLIDFRLTTEGICNLIRGLNKPYPGAHFVYKEEDVKVWEVSVGNNNERNIEPGKVLSVEGQKIEIRTGDASIFLLKHELVEFPEVGDYIL